MRSRLRLFLVLLPLLYSAASFGADCPNVGVHPGITAVFLQTDFGEKEAASKAYVAAFEEAIKKSRAYCLVQDVRAALFSLNLAGIVAGNAHAGRDVRGQLGGELEPVAGPLPAGGDRAADRVIRTRSPVELAPRVRAAQATA